MTYSVHDFVEGLFKATDFNSAFMLYQREVYRLGYDGALYTFIPKVILDTEFSIEPVYEVSRDYAPDYLKHYAEAGYYQHDPLISAVKDGVNEPIDWWGSICESYKQKGPESRDVIDESRSYGIQNGITIPLKSDSDGIAGASIISTERSGYEQLKTESISELVAITRLFHALVMNNINYRDGFSRPLLEKLSTRERQYLAALARGRKWDEIVAEQGITRKYQEQLMLRIRRKLSGVAQDQEPKINRNQVLYYAGLMNILEHT